MKIEQELIDNGFVKFTDQTEVNTLCYKYSYQLRVRDEEGVRNLLPRRRIRNLLSRNRRSRSAISYPVFGFDVTALMIALTSAAPFPKANKETPANRGGRPNFLLNISSAGEK